MRPFHSVPLRLGLLLTLGLSACFSEAPNATGPVGEVGAVVDMTPQLTFSPSRVEIRAGQAVRWRNTSAFGHTATADPAQARNPSSVRLPAGASPFDSGNIGAGLEFSHTFQIPGEYRYFCLPHEQAGMVGTVVVTP